MMKDELDGTILMKVLCLRPKMYSYITDDDKEKSTKGTKKCIIKRRLKFDHYKSCVKFDHLQELCKKKM